jgi:hypothetical protein
MEIELKHTIKRPLSSVASEFIRTNRMLIPSISKAERTYYGCSSLGTNDYRHGVGIRPDKEKSLKGTDCEVSKKRDIRKYILKPVGLQPTGSSHIII